MHHAKAQARCSATTRNDLLSFLVTGLNANITKTAAFPSGAAMNKLESMGATTFSSRPRKLRSNHKSEDGNSTVTTASTTQSLSMDLVDGPSRAPLGNHVLSRHHSAMQAPNGVANSLNCSSSSSAIPISKGISKHGRESAHWDQEVAENTRLYDSSTWRMYHRITEGRSRRPRSSVAPAPLRSKKLQLAREQSRRAWELSMKDQESGHELNDSSALPDEDTYEGIFTLDLE
jgi:hypothetical protein